MRKSLLAAAVLGLVLPATAGFAATFTVTKLTDDAGPCTPTDCSVREALIAARETPGPHVVVLPPGRHVLSIPGDEPGSFAGDLNINGTPVEMQGSPNGGTIIDANGLERPLTISNATAVLRDITLTGGTGGQANFAGGLFLSFADATLIRCTVIGNRAGAGGGILSSSSYLRMRDSLVANNTASVDGGGLIHAGRPGSVETATIVNSTFSGNSAGNYGGAIHSASPAALTISQSTFRGNTSPNATITHFGTTNTVLSNNLIDGNCLFDAASTLVTAGGNFESPGNTCRLTGFDFVDVADLGLGELAWNGGNTRTHALLASSPAVDALTACTETTDQRGFARPIDGDGDSVAACDSGAYELDPDQVLGGEPIPTAGVTGLALLAALLAAAACFVLRRG